jgi:hypothetical protein
MPPAAVRKWLRDNDIRSLALPRELSAAEWTTLVVELTGA